MTSLNKSIHKVVENNINIFAQRIAEKFDLDIDEILAIWYDNLDTKILADDKESYKDGSCYTSIW